jgi:hypothetical protein
MHQAQAASEDKKEKASVGTILHKIWNETAKAEQAYRREQTRRDREVNRLWGVMQAAFGGALYKLLMDHPSLTDDDKKFITAMKNVGVEKKFEKKMPEKAPLTPAEIQKRATASNV